MALSTKIDAGKLRWRITFVKPSGSQDSCGGISQTPSQWTPVLTTWASIDALAGRDHHATESFVETTSHRFEIRNPRFGSNDPDQGITNQMWIWFKSRTFQIVAILNPLEQNKKLIIMAQEVNQSNQQTPTATPA
jgi:head-tail adaptor